MAAVQTRAMCCTYSRHRRQLRAGSRGLTRPAAAIVRLRWAGVNGASWLQWNPLDAASVALGNRAAPPWQHQDTVDEGI